MIKYLQETQYDMLILKINDMIMADWYADGDFTVHTGMKIHMGGVLTMGKGSIQKNQRSRISAQKFLRKKNW